MPRPKTIQFLEPAAADAENIVVEETSEGGAMEIISEEFTADIPRHVQIVSSAADTEVLEITGTDRYGNTVVEDLTLNGTTPVVGTVNFSTIESVSVDAEASGSIDVGTADSFDSKWIPLDYRTDRASTSFVIKSSNSPSYTYTVEFAFEPVLNQFDPFLDSSLNAVNADDANIVAEAISEAETDYGNTTQTPTAARLSVSSWSAGDIDFTIIQPDAPANA